MLEPVPVEELDLQLIKSRSVKGVASLISGSLLVQLVSTAGFFFLTVYLGRSDIGLFFAVTEIIGMGLYPSSVPDPLKNDIAENEVYRLINDSRFSITDPASVGLKLVASYPKATQSNGVIEHLLSFQLTQIGS